MFSGVAVDDIGMYTYIYIGIIGKLYDWENSAISKVFCGQVGDDERKCE